MRPIAKGFSGGEGEDVKQGQISLLWPLISGLFVVVGVVLVRCTATQHAFSQQPALSTDVMPHGGSNINHLYPDPHDANPRHSSSPLSTTCYDSPQWHDYESLERRY